MLTKQHVLSNDLLTKFAERCAAYDRENRFFNEDFADLKAAGYALSVPITERPKEHVLIAKVKDPDGNQVELVQRPR